jgi:hemoglobin-like flavoprotein
MIDHKMTDIDNSKQKQISKHPIERSLPSNEVDKILNTSTSVHIHSESYKHVMDCINGLTKAMSTIATSIEPIITSWNKKGYHSDFDEVS